MRSILVIYNDLDSAHTSMINRTQTYELRASRFSCSVLMVNYVSTTLRL
jgi:hypothetical protein